MTTSGAPSPEVLPRLTATETLRLLATASRVLPRLLCRSLAALTETFGVGLRRLWKPMRTIKMGKRFLTGACLGYWISSYLLADRRFLTPRLHRLHGEIFGCWGVAIIAMDYVLDAFLKEEDRARGFLEHFSRILASARAPQGHDGAASPPWPALPPPASPAEELALGLAGILRGRLDGARTALKPYPAWARAFEPVYQLFFQRAEALLRGQLLSLRQFQVDGGV